MTIAWILSVLGLLIGAGLGLAGLFNPKWAARLVRLQEAAPGGFAEFRATYGGLFFGCHAAALAFIALQMWTDDIGVQTMAVGAVAVLGAAWAGSAGGRVLSIVRDKTGTRFNWRSVAFELGVSLCIAAPWVWWFVDALSA